MSRTGRAPPARRRRPGGTRPAPRRARGRCSAPHALRARQAMLVAWHRRSTIASSSSASVAVRFSNASRGGRRGRLGLQCRFSGGGRCSGTQSGSGRGDRRRTGQSGSAKDVAAGDDSWPIVRHRTPAPVTFFRRWRPVRRDRRYGPSWHRAVPRVSTPVYSA
jgi:hypothetical protein